MPHSDTSWDEQQRLLADAKTLAEFANLEPSGVETFRKGHPDFSRLRGGNTHPPLLKKMMC